MRIAIVGSRKYPFEQHVREFIDMFLGAGDIVVSGHSPGGGVDIWAEEHARQVGIGTDIYPIPSGDARTFRKRALERNWEIVDHCDGLIAFWDGWSTGTTHSYTAAVSKNKPVLLITPDTTSIIRKRQGHSFILCVDSHCAGQVV